MDPRRYGGLLRETGRRWLEDKAARLGAALAYYTALSLAPLLVIAIFIAGLVFGKEAAQGQLLDQIRGLVGDQGGQAVETMIAHANQPRTGSFAAILGVITLLAGATGVIVQLQDALNTIWEVAPKPGRGVISAQIVFFGAEFTKIYADRFGSRIVPARDAVPVTAEARAQQGIPRTEDLEAMSGRRA
jgi:membrane protein